MSTPAAPRVSVIVPNYNYARFLERRLSSIFNQTFQDFEVLYLDDASSDESTPVLTRCLEKWNERARVRIFQNETNSGSTFHQWNKGVREARGEYIWLAEADDFADPRLLETLVKKLDTQPQTTLAYCKSFVVHDDNSLHGHAEDELDVLDESHWKSDYVNNGRDECARFLVQNNTILNASAVVFRRAAYLEAGGADADFRLAGDWLMWIKIALLGDVSFCAEPLNYFRRHESSVRSSVGNSARRIVECYRVTGFVLSEVEVAPPLRERVLNALAEKWIKVIVPKRNASARRSNRAIYALARRSDGKINARLLKKFAAFIGDHLAWRARSLKEKVRPSN